MAVSVSASPVGALKFDASAFSRFAQSRDGEVARALLRDGLIVLNQMRRNATGIRVAGAQNPEGRGPRVRTGRLRSSLTLALGQDGFGVFCDIGTNVIYAKPLETGLRGGRTYPFMRPALSALRR